MDEIKSVRVRRSDTKSDSLDIKVTLYKEGRNEVLVGGFNNDRPVWIITSYKKSGIFKNYTNDEFILDYIIT
jgi:hypothetical protein